MNFPQWQRWSILALFAVIVFIVPVPAFATAPVERVYKIQASRFTYTPAVIQANPGDKVTIELTSLDVVHGLSIDGYNLATTVDPGQTARLTFIADREGTFRFRCTVTCGNMHPFMIGKLRVGRNVLLWRGVVVAGLALAGCAWLLKK